MNDKRQITLTQEELDCIGVKPGDAVEVWAEDGMEAIVIYKADGKSHFFDIGGEPCNLERRDEASNALACCTRYSIVPPSGISARGVTRYTLMDGHHLSCSSGVVRTLKTLDNPKKKLYTITMVLSFVLSSIGALNVLSTLSQKRGIFPKL